MAYASVTYSGQTGTTSSYTIPFGYIDAGDINVTVNGVTTSFTFTSSSIINISPAPTGTVVISRTTGIDDKVTTFVDGSAFLASEANNQNNQFLYAMQEATDNLGSAQASAASATASKNAAATSATSAASSATAAATSASNASTSASSASTSAANAASSASSSATSATSSATSATSSATSASTATTQATSASTSATNAASSATAASGSATSAASSASSAATSATTAASSATSAAAYASQAQAAASGGAVKISSGDTTADFVQNKLVAGSNITLTKNNAGANETLTVATSGLQGTLVSGTNIKTVNGNSLLGSGDLTVSSPATTYNTMISAIRALGITSSPTRGYNLWADAYNDSTGTDGLTSYGEQYDATNKWMSNFTGTYPASYTVVDETVDVNTGLLLHFENNVTDSSHNNLSLTATNITYVTGGSQKVGTHAASFNGTSSVITGTTGAGNATKLPGDFTIAAWVYLDSYSTYRVIMDTRTAAGSSPGLMLYATQTNGYLRAYYNSTDITTGTTAIPLNTWTHVACVRSGSTITCYVNGVAVGAATCAVNFSDGTICIGKDNTASSGYWSGRMDELIVRQSAMWTANFTPPTSAYNLSTGFALQTLPLTATNGTPTTGYIMLRHQDLLGTVTAGTDVLVDLSSNGGTTWNTVTGLTKADPYDANTNLMVGSVALTGDSTSMLARVRTANNKPQRIRGLSMYWS